ncbi:alpha/beta hydrolase family protein [Risungbinella massiliensis]|uniref:alpha/beta hydrolase family protein n=1 Tax=Risungbinella massiliensis TaxID=1329796 RepID=UPI0005CB96DA|nr:alpha/beta fold hydrolase [Risungbinella massiliensis]
MKQVFRLELGKDNRIITGDILAPTKPQGKAPVILLLHGFKAFKSWGFFPTLAKRLAKEGYVVISFNFSMNGVEYDQADEEVTNLDKFGRNTFSREQEDIATVLKALRDGDLPYAELCDVTKVGLFGHSRGGANALIYTLDDPSINCAVVWNSVAEVLFWEEKTIQEIMEKGVAYIENVRTKQQLPVTKEVIEDIQANQDRFAFLNRFALDSRPVLAVVGTADKERIVEGAKRLDRIAPHSDLQLIISGDHTFGSSHPLITISPMLEEAIGYTVEFYQEHLPTIK